MDSREAVTLLMICLTILMIYLIQYVFQKKTKKTDDLNLNVLV